MLSNWGDVRDLVSGAGSELPPSVSVPLTEATLAWPRHEDGGRHRRTHSGK